MNLYDEFYPVAVEMLEEFGTTATLTSTAPAAPSAAAKRSGRATPTSGAAQNRPVATIVSPLQIEGVDGRLETRSVATMLLEPREGDTLTMGAQVWKVGTVTRLAPQGQPIVFFAEVS